MANFEMALAWLREGKSITRKSWEDSVGHNKNFSSTLSIHSILAEDWMIVEEE